MKQLISMLAIALAMAGCASMTPTTTGATAATSSANSATVNYQNACADYVGLDAGVFAIAKTGVMTYPQILQFGIVDKNISPLCAPGVSPSSANLSKITAAIAALTAIEKANGVTKP